jgi:uncharacterized protein YjiS (DUF1127 family)
MSTSTMPARADAPAGGRIMTRDPNRLRALVERAIARIAHELSVRRATSDLTRLDDRMLRDIGLQRSGTHISAFVGDIASLKVRTRRIAWTPFIGG